MNTISKNISIALGVIFLVGGLAVTNVAQASETQKQLNLIRKKESLRNEIEINKAIIRELSRKMAKVAREIAREREGRKKKKIQVKHWEGKEEKAMSAKMKEHVRKHGKIK